MSPQEFCYWLSGYAELEPVNYPSPEQWEFIKRALFSTHSHLRAKSLVPGSKTDAAGNPVIGSESVDPWGEFTHLNNQFNLDL